MRTPATIRAWTTRLSWSMLAMALAYGPTPTWPRALAADSTAAPPRPNVIVFLIDDLGWTDLGCFGSKLYETPNIDRLASEGMRFTNGYAACTVCSPTRAAIVAGKYPARLHLTDWIAGHVRKNAKLKIPDWRKYLPLEEVTLAEALKPAGYVCAHVGKWHLGDEPYYPERQGFDVNLGGDKCGAPASYRWVAETRGNTLRIDLRTRRSVSSGRTATSRSSSTSPTTLSTRRCRPRRRWWPSTRRSWRRRARQGSAARSMRP